MKRLGLERGVVGPTVCPRAVGHFRDAGNVVPTFAQPAASATSPAGALGVRVALPGGV